MKKMENDTIELEKGNGKEHCNVRHEMGRIGFNERREMGRKFAFAIREGKWKSKSQ